MDAGRRAAAIAAGLVLDALLGDPHGWPHPVKLIGKQIEFEEGLVRSYLLSDELVQEQSLLPPEQLERLFGAAIAADVALLSPIAAHLALRACGKAHPAVAFALEVALFYQLLAARSLRDESMAVKAALDVGDLDGARHAVGMIVGRDTDGLDEEGVARAAVETVAENTSDGVVAPLLFMGLGGAPAALFYKAANTLDSMMGYKNERYANLGWASAKLDDIVNFAPARLAGVLMCAAAGLLGEDGPGAWRVFKRDRLNHPSPNAAQAEAACAGALGVQLGGRSKYGGVWVDKPTIGDARRPVVADDIERANRLMIATTVLGGAVSIGIALVGGRLRRRR